MEFIQELTHLGLKDEEASVYLASLELGPSPVQNIARKAKVVRATTYVILEALMKMGLVTKYKEGKKTLFSAEPPRQLTRLLEKEQDALKVKQDELDELLPELQVLMKTSGNRPSVRYFEGKEGLHAMRQEIVMHTKSGGTVYNFTPADYLVAVFPDREDSYFKQRVAKRVYGRTIFTTKSQTLKERWFSEHMDLYSERRFVDPERFPSTGGMTIFEDRVAIGAFTGKLMGVVIESPVMADMMRALFDLAWISAEKPGK